MDLCGKVRDGRVHVEPGSRLGRRAGAGRAAVVAPLMVQARCVGAVVAFYTQGHHLRPDDARVVREKQRPWSSAQVALSALADQEERLMKAELHGVDRGTTIRMVVPNSTSEFG